MSEKEQSVLIVGAGAFGISTAVHLLRRGWKNVKIIDRSSVLPAPDAASSDLNKVVRTSYSDITYTRLTKEAITEWKKEEWGNSYHESGVLVRGGPGSYGNLAFQNDKAEGIRTREIQDGHCLQAIFPPDIRLGPITESFEGYLNMDSGWAAASQGVEYAIKQVRQLGGQIEVDKRATELNLDVTGVKLEDGTEIKAKFIVIATGSWTPATFSELGIATRVLATGQCLATMQLTAEEAQIYKDIPVYLDYTTGFYMFPPNHDNIVKIAIHLAGFTHMLDQRGRPISTPRTFLTDDNGGAIPRRIVHLLRKYLSEIFPDLGNKPFSGTRLCWYADTSDSNWLIDFHPQYPSVLFATGGSGHAFKFLPILGHIVADRLENKLEPSLARKFAFDRIVTGGYSADLTRQTTHTEELELNELCLPRDLSP